MKIHPGYRRFDHATNASLMREYLARPLAERTSVACVDDVRVTRAFPRPAGGFTIQYVVVDGGVEKIFCGRLLGNAEPPPDFIARDRDRVIWIEAIGLVVPLFPFDPVLDSLADVVSEKGVGEILSSVGGVHGSGSRAQVLGYRLEKRCVLLLGDNAPVVAKVVRRKKLNAIVAAHVHLAQRGFADPSADGVTIPRVLHVDEGRSLFVMDMVGGRSLHDVVEDDGFVAGCKAAAAVLNKLGAVDTDGLSRYTPDDEMRQLGDWVTRVGGMFPAQKDRFARCIGLLAAGPIDAPRAGNTTCVHRDFYDKQLILANQRATLLDCDNIAAGDPAQDHGNFVAHAELRSLQHRDSAGTIEDGIAAFSGAFRVLEGSFLERARWWRGAALLRLAALYALRPRWRHLTEPLLEKAESCVQSNIS